MPIDIQHIPAAMSWYQSQSHLLSVKLNLMRLKKQIQELTLLAEVTIRAEFATSQIPQIQFNQGTSDNMSIFHRCCCISIRRGICSCCHYSKRRNINFQNKVLAAIGVIQKQIKRDRYPAVVDESNTNTLLASSA